MKHFYILFAACFLSLTVGSSQAQDEAPTKGDAPTKADPSTATPMDIPLPDDKETLIHCVWPESTKMPKPYSEHYAVDAGNYSYRLYVPPGYHDHPDWTYPALFISSPGGNANIGTFQEQARNEGWLVIMFVEAKNGPWGPKFGNMMSGYEDAMKRVHIQEGLKFGTGFSGGGHATSLFVQVLPGFAGILLQGAGFAFLDNGSYEVKGVPHGTPFAVFMGVGLKDPRLEEVARMKTVLDPTPFKSETFDGGHQGCPANIFDDGIQWLLDKTLNRSDLNSDLRPFAGRHFDYLTGKIPGEPDGKEKAAHLKSLIDFATKLNLDQDSARATKINSLQDALAKINQAP